jgi:glycosyltransferase involved in cell wall biosynthesis
VIAVLHPSDELYGADRVLLAVVDRLLVDGHAVAVLIPDDLDYPERLLSATLAGRGVTVQRLPLPVLRRANAHPRGMARLLAQQVALLRWLRRHRPSRLYVNTTALAPALLPARTLRIPATLHVHETFGPTERRIIGPMLPLADRIVVVSEATRAALPGHARARAILERREVPPIPAPPPAESLALRRAAGVPDDATVVLLASRWTPGKGGRVAIDALAGTDRQDLRLVVLGGPPPIGRGEDLRALAARSPARDRVVVVGEVPDVVPWLFASDAVALPSILPDSYPTLALEAVAAGVPVLAARIGGLPEIVGPEVGLLLEPGDVPAWTRAFAAVQRRAAGCR